ncbi:MAG: DNA repair protein RecN [Verrucomicrobiaceae bacterium]|nr:DNA repair protein RecN [Verrucomicrobiaceae bacterium]
MLSVLKITNLALVDVLTWELGDGLVCVTGETGAGKSIIVGAIKLVLGDRADRSLVRTGTEACTVEAVFELPNVALVNEQLEAFGFEPCEDNQVVIKRVIGAKSGGKQFINCSPATLTVLKALGHFLVDLHGPHDHQSLISQDRQLNMLDAFAGSEKVRINYVEAYKKWAGLAKELEELSTSERANEQEIDLLRFQIQDIGDADPKPDEVGPLEQRHQVASNAAHLMSITGKLLNQLADSDTSVINQLADSARLIRDLQSTDPQTSEFTREFDSAQGELEEMVGSLRSYVEDLEIDPKEISEIEDRINLLETLKRKYGNTIEEVIAFRERAVAKLSKIEGRGDAIAKLESDLKKVRKAVDSKAVKLTQARRAAAPKLSRRIADHLKDLGFKRSKIEIDLVPFEFPAPQGAETVDFIFAPNPGEPSKPLRIIASSGEMARVMLAVKSALAKQDAIPLLVFDEIDANVGGEIASAVGAKMSELAKNHQVISITHLPQVAALADGHCVVEKEFASNRTRSRLQTIDGNDRIAELARMLGGDAKSAKAHAKSLLGK